MINLNHYLDPVCLDKPAIKHLSVTAGFSHNITVNTGNNELSDTKGYSIALIGVPDDRRSANSGAALAPDSIRESLYSFSRLPGKLKIIDLGNLKYGTTFEDTLAGLKDVLVKVSDAGTVPVLLGGTSALMPAADRFLSLEKKPWSLVTVDSRLDFTPEKKEPDSFNWMNDLIYRSGSHLSHLASIGHQTYLTDQQVVNRFIRRHYSIVRIGEVRAAMHETEPLFRDANAAIFDIGAVRQSDAPGTILPSANGFYGEEICLLARYAGLSDNLKLFGLFEVNPSLDSRGQSTQLAAQIIWFFLEGFSQKQFEVSSLPDQQNPRFTRYHVTLTDLGSEIIFIKSALTERWWLEIKDLSGETHYLACAYEDYLKANNDQVPERWTSGHLRFSR